VQAIETLSNLFFQLPYLYSNLLFFFYIVQTDRQRPAVAMVRAEREAWRRVAANYLQALLRVERELADLELQQERQGEVISTDNICRVYLAAARNVLLMPCRHLETSSTCAEALITCPVCREEIAERMRVFL